MITSFERKLAEELDGTFIKYEHTSYNKHYYGYSDSFQQKVFIKIFEDRKKFDQEKKSVLLFTGNYITDFCLDNKFILVLRFIEYSEIESLSNNEIAKIAERIASFHMGTNLNHCEDESKISEKIKRTLNKVKKRNDFIYLETLVLKFQEFFELVDIEYMNTERVRIHGDFSLRNLKKNRGEIELFDFERSSQNNYYLDFIKFFYIDLMSQNEKIELFLSHYYANSSSEPISVLLKHAFILYTALGIMKYTMDFEDDNFEEVGFRMLQDVEIFLENKNHLKAMLLFALGDSLGHATTHYTKEEIKQLYNKYIIGHEEKIYKVTKKQKWSKGETTDDTAQFLAVAKSIVKNNGVNRSDIYSILETLEYRYRKKTTSTGKALNKHDSEFVSYFGVGNGVFAQCLPLMLYYGLPNNIKENIDNGLIGDTVKIATLTHGNVSAVSAAVFLNTYILSLLKISKNPIYNTLMEYKGFSEQYNRKIEFDNFLLGFLLNPEQVINYFNKVNDGEFAFNIIESLPYILSFEMEDLPVKAILLKGLNLGGDADSVLSVVGFILGIKNESIEDMFELFEVFFKVNRSLYIQLTQCYYNFLLIKV